MDRKTLLAVDLGLRTGFAVYGFDGSTVGLQSYRSSHAGSRATLRRLVAAVLSQVDDLSQIVVEGDRDMANLWERAGNRLSVPTMRVTPEQWRARLFWPRDRAPSATAKEAARRRATEVIKWSRSQTGAPSAATQQLRTDTADAIMIGLWGVLELGWMQGADVPFPKPH